MSDPSTQNPQSTFSSIKRSFSKILRFDLIAITALVLSVIGTCNDCRRNQKDDENQYQINQATFRPFLRIIKTELDKASFRSDPIDFNTLLVDSSIAHDVDFSATVKLRFFITNVGNSRADIKGKIFLDTTSGEQIIKKIVQNKNYPIDLDELPGSYYPDEQVEPGDTIKNWHTFPVQFIKDSTFTIHAFYIYTNELGQVFDTYYRERFTLHSMLISTNMINNEYPILTKNIIETFDHGRNSSETYSKEGGEQLFETMKLRFKK